MAVYNGYDHFLLLMLKGVSGLLYLTTLSHRFIRSKCSMAMLGITLTLSEDKEASLTGMSSEPRLWKDEATGYVDLTSLPLRLHLLRFGNNR